jgi:hypothetical protein
VGTYTDCTHFSWHATFVSRPTALLISSARILLEGKWKSDY